MSSLIACTKHRENRYTARSERTNERRRPQLNASQKHTQRIFYRLSRGRENRQRHTHTEFGYRCIGRMRWNNGQRDLPRKFDTNELDLFFSGQTVKRRNMCAIFQWGDACLSVCVRPRSTRVVMVLVLHLKQKYLSGCFILFVRMLCYYY